MCRDADGEHVAIELKRHAGIDATEQLTRYLELLNRDPLLAPVKGVLAAQTIKLQARTLADHRAIRCVVLDYDAMRGIEREGTLFYPPDPPAVLDVKPATIACSTGLSGAASGNWVCRATPGCAMIRGARPRCGHEAA